MNINSIVSNAYQKIDKRIAELRATEECKHLTYLEALSIVLEEHPEWAILEPFAEP